VIKGVNEALEWGWGSMRSESGDGLVSFHSITSGTPSTAYLAM